VNKLETTRMLREKSGTSRKLQWIHRIH